MSIYVTQQTLNITSYKNVKGINFAVYCQKEGRWELPKQCHPVWESNPSPHSQMGYHCTTPHFIFWLLIKQIFVGKAPWSSG